MNRYLLIIFILFSASIQVVAQDRHNIDSLFQIIDGKTNDSLKIEAYNEVVWEYYGKLNDSALFYANKAIKLAKRTPYKIALGNAYRIAGLVYERMSDYPKALDHQQMALKIYEKSDFKPGIANSLNNIAVIFKAQDEFEKALDYQTRALKICEETDMKPGIAACLGNMGNIHNQLGQRDQALECYLKALEIDKELKNDYGIGVSLVNIGSIYLQLKQYQKSLEYLQQSIEVRKKLGSTQGLAISYNTMGDVYMAIKNVFRAEECYRESLKLSAEAGAIESLKDANHGLYSIAKKKNDSKNALLYYEEFVLLKDSIFNSRKAEEMSSLKTKFELEKQESDLKQKSEIEKKLIQEENRLKDEHNEKVREQEHFRDMLVIYAVVIVLIIVLVFSFFLYNRFRITNRQKKIIEEQKKEVEEKNKQITDSINYAQRIQNALLPAEIDLQKYFSESFIFFQPKDIVSGDFVWLHGIEENQQKYLFLAVADCTGHGVPGGFMSMLGTSFLNEIVIEKKIYEADEVLNQLRSKVIYSLKQTEDSEGAKDGMDIVFIKINLFTRVVDYAAANNGFYSINLNGVMTEHNPDKMPIGVFGEMKPFTKKTFTCNSGDGIYLFSDGYADQFGGQDGKKFKYNQLEKLLAIVHPQDATMQKDRIIHSFDTWKKDYEQVDDVCVIGLKF